MPCHRREIERKSLQVGDNLIPIKPAENKRQEDIQEQKRDRRRKHTLEAPAIETPHGLTGLQGHKKERRHYHEKRHASPRHRPVIERHPKARALIRQQGSVPDKPRGAAGIEILARVHEHYKETRDDADIIDEDDALLFHGGKRLCTNITIFPEECHASSRSACEGRSRGRRKGRGRGPRPH